MRQRFARLALIVWALGFELIPAIHVARHAAAPDHEHDRAHRGPELDPDHDHDHDAPGGPIDADHGDGSLEHRGVAATEAIVVAFAAPIAPVEEIDPPSPPPSAPRSREPRSLRSRGPPPSLV